MSSLQRRVSGCGGALQAPAPGSCSRILLQAPGPGSCSKITQATVRSEVNRPLQAVSVMRPTGCHVSAFLLLIFAQLLTSLMFFAGVFIRSDRVLVSPFLICGSHGSGELQCVHVTAAESGSKINALPALVVLGLYIPVALVAFALLATVLAAYARDRAALGFSAACQAASSLLLLTGVVCFLLLHQSHATWGDMTPWFYCCVGAQVELAATAALTYVLWRGGGT